MTKTLYLDASQPGDIQLAAQKLQRGKLVAFPTETVYGLGGLALCEESVLRIFAAKNRPKHNPLIIHVATFEEARALFDFDGSAFSKQFRHRFESLAAAFWPGPLTLVGKRSDRVSPTVTAGSPKVAVRIPSHPVAIRLLEQVGQPIAAPSANLFTRPSPTHARHVLASLEGRIDVILDGGLAEFGIESTVVDIDAETAKLLRHGAIAFPELEKHLSSLQLNHIGMHQKEGSASPGLSIKHYAPKIGQVSLADEGEIAKAWFGSHGIILRSSTQKRLEKHLGWRPSAAGPIRILPDDPKSFAQGLFVAFYEMEGMNPETLLVENLLPLAEASDWTAICDRLIRASRS